MLVRLFRRNNRTSFSVQLSNTSGIVEVHCTQVLVKPPSSKMQLEDLLLKMGRHPDFFAREMGGAHHARGWKVQLVELGRYDLKARGFVGCKILFEKSSATEDDVAETPRRTTIEDTPHPAAAAAAETPRRTTIEDTPHPAAAAAEETPRRRKRKTFFRWLMRGATK